MKFEEAKIGKTNDIIDVNQILDYAKSDPKLFNIIRNDLYCPDCHKAKLTLYFNVSSPFFKTKNGEKHSNNCNKKQPQMTNKEREDFLFSASSDVVQAQLENVLTNLFKQYSNNNTTFTERKISNIECHNSNKKTIPRKRIDRPLDDEDYDVIKYFYGKVNTQFDVIEKEGVIQNHLKILSTDNKTVYCDITVSHNVYLYLDKRYVINHNNVEFAYLGKIRRYKNKNYSTAIKSYCILINI